jgi:hypothetical protein
MIICRGTNDTDGRTDRRTNGQLFTSLFRDKLSLQGARICCEYDSNEYFYGVGRGWIQQFLA